VRRLAWWGALFVGLALATPGWAQKKTMHSGKVNPNDLVNRPVDMSGAIAPVSPPAQKPFGLNNFIPHFAIPGLTQRVAVSPLPPPAAFPSTKYRNFTLPQSSTTTNK